VFERFTERARRVIILAREEAGRFRHDFVGTEHILLGLIRDGEGIATAVLQRLGLRLDARDRRGLRRQRPAGDCLEVESRFADLLAPGGRQWLGCLADLPAHWPCPPADT